jgi:1,4-dihydroxy-2-naphthoyl-CoA hydrolase
MSIWRSELSPELLQKMRRGTLAEHLDIQFLERGADYLTASMPVDHRTIQTMGILHGGASVALAETVASVAANLCVDPETQACVGQEINANHLRPVSEGRVIGTAKPVHLGSRSQVWQIEIRDERGRLTCVSRLTLAIVNHTAVQKAQHV